MKAKLEGWSNIQSGSIILMSDDGQDIASMTINGLSNVSRISEYKTVCREVAQLVVTAIGQYTPPVEEEDLKRPIVGEVYLHFKGDKYEVLGFTRNSSTLETEVRYAKVNKPEEEWTRALREWFEPVRRGGVEMTRFTHFPRMSGKYDLDIHGEFINEPFTA